MNENDTRTKRRIAAIKAATTGAALSQIDIAAACFMNQVSAGDYLRELVASKQMHIAGWGETDHRHKVALYTWGAGRNVPKPRPRSKVMIERARLKRIKADPDAHARYLSMHRARYAINKAVKTPQSWLSALGAV